MRLPSLLSRRMGSAPRAYGVMNITRSGFKMHLMWVRARGGEHALPLRGIQAHGLIHQHVLARLQGRCREMRAIVCLCG